MKTVKFFTFLMLLFADNLLMSAQTTTCIIQGDSCYVTKCYTERCASANKHQIFNFPKNEQPIQVAHLGSAPQFGTLKNFKTTSEVFNYLKEVHQLNHNSNAQELDALWNAMGFAGFNDPDFTVNSLDIIYYSGGATGMLGGAGHKYAYSNISSGQNIMLKGYKVKAKTPNSDITIMETCGNAFFAGCGENCMTTAVALELPSWAKTGNVVRFGFTKDEVPYIRVCDAATPIKIHSIYNIPEGATPKRVTMLNEQFGSLKYYTTPEQVYNHLKKLYFNEKSGAANELDRLWTAMGYHGFNDHRFIVASIRIMNYEGGMTGMVGNGMQKYEFVKLPNTPMRGFQIHAIANCDLTLLENGGNVFFSGCSVGECEEYPANQNFNPNVKFYGSRMMESKPATTPGFLRSLKK